MRNITSHEPSPCPLFLSFPPSRYGHRTRHSSRDKKKKDDYSKARDRRGNHERDMKTATQPGTETKQRERKRKRKEQARETQKKSLAHSPEHDSIQQCNRTSEQRAHSINHLTANIFVRPSPGNPPRRGFLLAGVTARTFSETAPSVRRRSGSGRRHDTLR